MLSMTYRFILLSLLIGCLPGCAKEQEQKIRFNYSSAPFEPGQARDGGNMPSDAGMPSDAAIADDAQAQGDASVVTTTVSSLSAEAWSRLCTGLAGSIESADRPDEDLKFGYCIGQYNAEVEDYASVQSADCGDKILDCIDGVGDGYLPPLAICENADEPPAECEIGADQFDSCMRQLIDAQLTMSVQDVCDPGVDDVAEFRRTHSSYVYARECLDALAEKCPALQ